MRRSIIAGVALVLAAGVGLTVWLVTKSTGRRMEFTTPDAAVRSVCGAKSTFVRDPALESSGHGARAVGRAYVGGAPPIRGKFTVIWSPHKLDSGGIDNPPIATVESTSSGKYRVDSCK